MKKLLRTPVLPGLILLVGCPLAAVAGPDWEELPHGDAGSLPGDAQFVDFNQSAPLHSLKGRLDGKGTGPILDFEDMYLVTLLNPEDLFISTEQIGGGDPDFDTSLWLFTGPDHPLGPGLGILGNLKCEGCDTGAAALTERNADGSEVPELIVGLTYYLAISGDGNVPISADGPIFHFDLADEVSGPDGPGGSLPIIGWSAPGDYGDYLLPNISGVGGVPEPATLSLLGLALLAVVRRRSV